MLRIIICSIILNLKIVKSQGGFNHARFKPSEIEIDLIENGLERYDLYYPTSAPPTTTETTTKPKRKRPKTEPELTTTSSTTGLPSRQPETSPVVLTTPCPECTISCFHCDAPNMTHCESIGSYKDSFYSYTKSYCGIG